MQSDSNQTLVNNITVENIAGLPCKISITLFWTFNQKQRKEVRILNSWDSRKLYTFL